MPVVGAQERAHRREGRVGDDAGDVHASGDRVDGERRTVAEAVQEDGRAARATSHVSDRRLHVEAFLAAERVALATRLTVRAEVEREDGEAAPVIVALELEQAASSVSAGRGGVVDDHDGRSSAGGLHKPATEGEAIRGQELDFLVAESEVSRGALHTRPAAARQGVRNVDRRKEEYAGHHGDQREEHPEHVRTVSRHPPAGIRLPPRRET